MIKWYTKIEKASSKRGSMKKRLILIIATILMLPIVVNAQTLTLRDVILRDNPVRVGADFTTVADSTNTATQEGLFRATDNHGMSYFFRGTHTGLNNNVIFAGHQWKIIRIEGNGVIRMIYNGECPDNECTINGNAAGAAATIGNSIFNPSPNHNRYVGFMFGSETGTFAQQHANTNASTIKTFLDNWYDNNITGTYRTWVNPNTTFCIDRSIANEAGHSVPGWGTGVIGTGLGTTPTSYGTLERMISFTPTLVCPRAADRITTPIGLINHDEANKAGGRWGLTNNDYFLRTGQWYWTMSPADFHGVNARIFAAHPVGDLGSIGGGGGNAGFNLAVRPVISLRANVTATGDGSLENPYIITGLYEPTPNQNNPSNPNEDREGNNYNPQTSTPSLLVFSGLAAGSLAALALINRKKRK